MLLSTNSPSYTETSEKGYVPLPAFAPAKYCPTYFVPSGNSSVPWPCCFPRSHWEEVHRGECRLPLRVLVCETTLLIESRAAMQPRKRGSSPLSSESLTLRRARARRRRSPCSPQTGAA